MRKLKNKKPKCPNCNYALENDNYCVRCGLWISEEKAVCGVCGDELSEKWIEVDKEGKEYSYYTVCNTCNKILCEMCDCGIKSFDFSEDTCSECNKTYYKNNICPECDDKDCRLCKFSDDYNPTSEELEEIEGREAFYNLTHDEYGNIERGWEHLFDD